MLDILGTLLMGAGAAFFVVGTIGLLCFPDVFCRLHALTKADGMGLALVCLGAAISAPDWGEALRIGLVWAFVALASATGGHLIARHARRTGATVCEVRP